MRVMRVGQVGEGAASEVVGLGGRGLRGRLVLADAG